MLFFENRKLFVDVIFCLRIGISARRIHDCGYETRGRNFTQRRHTLKNNLIILPKEKLEKLYLEEKRAITEISKILKVSYYFLSQNFK